MLSLWHVHESLLGELVLLEVSSIKVNAALKHWNELLWWILLVLPKNIIGLRGTFLGVVTSLESNEVETAVPLNNEFICSELLTTPLPSISRNVL